MKCLAGNERTSMHTVNKLFVTPIMRLRSNIYIRMLNYAQNKCGTFYMNRTTFRDL